MALDSLKPGKTFSSWEEVEKFMKELESVNFFPLRFDDTKTIVSYNKAVSKKLFYFLLKDLNHFQSCSFLFDLTYLNISCFFKY